MRPFVAPLDAFHASTAPADWLEGLVKAYVGRRHRCRLLPGDLGAARRRDARPWCSRSSRDTGHSAFVVSKVRAAIEADPRVAGRLALWGRRLMGEALSQAQRVAAERDALAGAARRRAPAAGGWTWSSWAGCSPGSPSSTPSGWPRSAWRPERSRAATAVLHRAEADAAGLLLTDLDVGELVGGHQDAAARLSVRSNRAAGSVAQARTRTRRRPGSGRSRRPAPGRRPSPRP